VETTDVDTSPALQPPSTRERMKELMPAEQAMVVTAIEAARKQYSEAPNDMAKGASRPTRARGISAALRSLSVVGWIGIVEELSLNHA